MSLPLQTAVYMSATGETSEKADITFLVISLFSRSRELLTVFNYDLLFLLSQ